MAKKATVRAQKRCLACAGEMIPTGTVYRYTESGLDNVVLVGVTSWKCSTCGETEVSLPRIAQLHQVIDGLLARKPERLTPR